MILKFLAVEPRVSKLKLFACFFKLILRQSALASIASPSAVKLVVKPLCLLK